MAATVSKPETTRQAGEIPIVSIPFSDIAYEAIRERSDRKGIKPADEVRDAISFAWYLDDAIDSGGRVIVEHPNGTRETITRRK